MESMEDDAGKGYCIGSLRPAPTAYNLNSNRLYRVRRNGENFTSASHHATGGDEVANESHPADGEQQGGGVSSITRQYTLPMASCSLLESYVTGTGSPLRNLYCQCKHHSVRQ